MNIIFLGPPGAGKGTQGGLLSCQMGHPQISTGDLLRKAVNDETDLGKRAKEFMDQGLLVPDEVIMGLIEEVLRSPVAEDGVLMDGFPRTVAQAEAVDEFLTRRGSSVDHVISMEASEEELVKRLLGRAEEQGRSDDNETAIKRRLEVYLEQTEPLVTFYDARGILRRINAVGAIDEVRSRVNAAVGL